MLELNRMAFDEVLPKIQNQDVFRYRLNLLKKYYPNIKWIL